MSTLQERAAEAKMKLNSTAEVTASRPEAANPANPAGESAPRVERKRIPMSLPTQKLAAAEIPGYFTYWMRGIPDRLLQADRAGFEFVSQEEALINNVSLGGDTMKDGSTDMGSRVSVLASSTSGGEIGSDNQPIRLYLMKQKWEWHMEDENLLQQRNLSVADALSGQFDAGTVGGKAPGESSEDLAQRYVDRSRSRRPDLFKPKPQGRPRG